MNQQQILEEIASLLEAILEETEIISGHSGKVPQIELDIVLENIRRLYSAYHKLNKINDKPSLSTDDFSSKDEKGQNTKLPEQVPQKEIVSPKAETIAPANKEFNVDDQSRSATDKTDPRNVIEKESQGPPEEEKAGQDQEMPESKPRYTIPKRPSDIPVTVSKQAENKEDDKPLSIGETYNKSEKTINDRVENPTEVSVADRLKQNRITDLKAALGINDKFLFINDLFKGDSEKYNKALETLNSFEGYQEAGVYLNHLKKEYDWDESSPVYKKLNDFVRRRYL